jgi:hypothetical protein
MDHALSLLRDRARTGNRLLSHPAQAFVDGTDALTRLIPGTSRQLRDPGRGLRKLDAIAVPTGASSQLPRSAVIKQRQPCLTQTAVLPGGVAGKATGIPVRRDTQRCGAIGQGAL